MAMDQMQLVVDGLNRDPFNLGLSLIAFDSMPPNKLLQIVTDVLRWITQDEAVDITREDPGETAMRILQKLRILNYKPPANPDEIEEWRAGVVEGSKRSLYPVLIYIFNNVEMLKERAYLAKYLMRIEVPSEVHDVDTAQLQDELAQLRERFKEVHQRVVGVRQDSLLLDDIRADLNTMEQEKEALTHKIERAERRVQNLPGLEKFMAAAAELRNQKERLTELSLQKTEQREGVIHNEQKLQRLRTQLNEVKAAGENIDPTNVIAQLEDEIDTNSYLVNTKLVADIESKRQIVHELSKISDLPAIDQKDINQLQNQINALSAKIKDMEEARDKSEEGLEDNFSIFRHQAAAVERKKAGVAQRLQEIRQEVARAEARVDEKKQEIRNRSGIDVISGREFREYASKMREKTMEYKRKRAELDEMLSEKSVLMRTVDTLNNRLRILKEKIENMGGEILEDIEVRVHQRPRTAAPKTEDVTELREMIKQLMSDLDRKRDEIDPLKREKDNRQATFNELNEAIRMKRNEFENRKENLEMGYANLTEEVRELEERENRLASVIPELEQKISSAKEALRELEEGGTGLVNRLEAEIKAAQQESEELQNRNDAAGRGVDLDLSRARMEMWKSLVTLFELKQSLAAQNI